jgi:hypothetical protein
MYGLTSSPRPDPVWRLAGLAAHVLSVEYEPSLSNQENGSIERFGQLDQERHLHLFFRSTYH